MALNKLTDNEAIEIAMQVRDNLELDSELELVERWREKDALAQVINLASRAKKEEGEAHVY